jgi:hypothetical protein
MFVRLLSGHPNCYPDGDGSSFLGSDARLGVNLLPRHNIRQMLRMQGDISPLIKTSLCDGTCVRTATVTQKSKQIKTIPIRNNGIGRGSVIEHAV